jgi:hypothetical protein
VSGQVHACDLSDNAYVTGLCDVTELMAPDTREYGEGEEDLHCYCHTQKGSGHALQAEEQATGSFI